MSFEINLILYFVAVADELSFRKAADKLHIAQPWLSRQVRKLEIQLGFDLFVRTTRHVELTEKGRRLLERARHVTDEVNATRSLARTLAQEQPDQIRFGLPYYGIYVKERMALFDRFSARYPAIRLEVVIGNARELLDGLDSGAIDILFRTAGRQDILGVDALTLCEGKLDVLMSEGDPLTSLTRIQFSDMRGREIAGFPRESTGDLYELFFGLFEERGFKINAFADYSFTRRLDELKMVTVLPSWVPLPSPGVVRRPLAGVDRVLKFQILRRRGEQSTTLERFWKMAEGSAAIAQETGLF